MTVIRASEIGNYLYCHRAWWYRKQGVESANQAEMAAGMVLHRGHVRVVLTAGRMRAAGYVFLLAALALLASYCTAHLL